jgi:geranylgeranyl diphosphate synthase type II
MPGAPFVLEPYLAARREEVERALATRFDAAVARAPAQVGEAMRYALLGGGKRLRPILCLAFFEAVAPVGASRELALDAACALELVHTYSLVHDDLPAMDDDDLRRGRPTCHKVYGEAMAILAGDGLLTLAFEQLARGPAGPRAAMCLELAQAAGASGMVGGQALDIAADRPAELDYLTRLHRLKTGALLRAACRLGALAAAAAPATLAAAGAYGEAVGLAFQIADDLLDATSSPEALGKPAGADAAAGRATFPAVVGLERSRALAKAQVEEAVRAVAALEPGPGPLAALARYALERRS